MNFLTNVWDFVLLFFWAFIFISALFIVFSVVSDLIRDKELNGWAKAIWAVFLISVPFLTALIYLIARGKGMSERQVARAAQAQQATDSYIREVAGSSPSASAVSFRAPACSPA